MGTKIIAVLAVLCVAFSCRQAQMTSKPNIILIMADDLGFDDLGIRNQDIKTPYLDQLYRESASFSQFYVNPVCAPSRASLLTGRDFIRTGVSHVHGGKDFIHLDEILLPQALKTNGYATGMWGKWHSGHSLGYFPWERGFDEAYMADLYKHQKSSGLYNGKPVGHTKWADEAIVDYAIDFIDKNRGRPFFAFLSSLSPHVPLRAPDSITATYEQRGMSRNLATLYAMVTMLDTQVGRLLDHLEKAGLDENTIVIFLSDNGPQISTGLITPEERLRRYVSGLKGHKGNIWENGVKSPLFVKWKGKIIAGNRVQLADITDLYPTLIALAGGIYPENQLPIDGQSLTHQLFTGNDKQDKLNFNWAHFGWAPLDSRPYSVDGEPNEYAPILKGELKFEDQMMSIRSQRYKLMLNPQRVDGMDSEPPAWHLYDILTDPTEEKNLIDSLPKVVSELKQQLQNHFGSVVAEKHAFEVPSFVIRSDSNLMAMVLANGPSHFSSTMLNSALEMKYIKKGSQVNYHILVEEDGLYGIYAKWKLHHCSAAPMVSIKIGEMEVFTSSMDNSGAEFLPIQLSKGIQTMYVMFESDGVPKCDTLLMSLRDFTISKKE